MSRTGQEAFRAKNFAAAKHLGMISAKCPHSCVVKYRFIIFMCLMSLAAFTMNAFSQSNVRISGRVFDAISGAPLADAQIEVENSWFGAATDEDGVFIIENVPPGSYTLSAFYVGFQTQTRSGVVVTTETTQRLAFSLQPQEIRTDSVMVVSDANAADFSIDGEKTVLNRADIERYESLGLANLLQQVAGVQIESTGGSGSYSQIRIHGSRSSQVLVQLDGQRLNNPQTGEVDLSEVPLDQIEKIEVVRQGNTAVYGGSAFGGVISFKTSERQGGNSGKIRSQVGSFETAIGGISGIISYNNLRLAASYQQDYSRQNYEYIYEGEQFARENAWYQNRKLFGKLSYLSNRHRLNVVYNQREGKQGLPSAFFEEMNHFDALMDGATRSLQGNYRWIASSKALFEGMIAYHSIDQLFNNELDFSPFTRYKVQQKNDTYEGKASGHYMLHPSLETRLGVHYYQEELDHQSLLAAERSIGRHKRDTAAGFGSLGWHLPVSKSIAKALQFRAALRYEQYFDQPGDWFPLLGLSFTPSVFPALSLSGGWAKAVRYPDFNSLFWKGDARARGNPELLPERKRVANVSARLRFPKQPYAPVFSFYYFTEEIEDLIFWHRTVTGTWEPRNEARVNKQGLDVEFEQNLIQDHARIQASYSYIDARNKSDEPNRQNKQIVFTPEHTVNTTLWLSLWRFQGLLIYRYVSDRQVTAANTGSPLAAYDLWDASVTFIRNFRKLQLDLGVALKNLTDTQYQLLRGYPMPGRNIQFTLQLTFTTN